MPLLGAIDIALSGLDAYSQGLQIISNNVANLDTSGYKAQTVNFSDIFEYGQGGESYGGGTTPDQSGNGVLLDQPGIDFSQGTMNQTGNALDLAVQGSGFLVLQNNGQTYYTTTGSFAVDSQGYITESGTSNHLTVLNSSNEATPVNITSYETNPPVATTTVTLGDNLSSSGTTASVSNVTVYDSTGAAHTWTINLTANSSTPGSWSVSVVDSTGATVGTGTVTFNGGVASPTTDKLTISTTPTGASPLSVVLDFSNVTSYSAGTTSTLATTAVDGNAAGSLTGVSVNSSGQVLLTYSNSQTKQLGSVAMANFSNPQKLTQISGGLLQNTSDEQAQLGASAAGLNGTLVSDQIESSNVNLSEEFGDLILIQRGFQASSEVLSTANDMIQQLFGVRGQG